MYEFPHELPKDFGVRILENFKKIPEMIEFGGE